VERSKNRVIMKSCTGMNQNRSDYAICSDNHKVYVVGGRSGSNTTTDRVERYDSDKDRWVEL